MHCGPEKHVKEMARIIKYLCENDDLKLTFDVVPDDDGLDDDEEIEEDEYID